ncbi:hypothetical protein JCM19047_4551 [Bacillus sp. JCM 19047]|nr:hypothetical protein JCM19047_4551 [Bacillus sp. JCM 19047]
MPRSSFKNRKALNDKREFVFGSIWKLNDEEIAIPQADKLGNRVTHKERWVVVVSNNSENNHPLCPLVSIAPLSSQVHLKKQHDLDLFKSEDSVEKDCLLQLKLIQPILKKDLITLMGEICEDRKLELQVTLDSYFGLTTDDLFEEEFEENA